MATYKSIKYVIPIEAVEHTDSINSLSDVDTVTTAPTDYQILVWSAADSKWYPGNLSEITGTQKAIFGFGNSGSYTNVTNLVSSVGVVSADTTGVGTARDDVAAAGYGGDKALFGFGQNGSMYAFTQHNVTNVVSNTGVVSTDVTGVGTSRQEIAAAGYGEDKAIFGFGQTGDFYNRTATNVTNLVSNLGVVATDTTGVGSARSRLAAAGFGGDKAIFGFGEKTWGGNRTNVTNLVSNTGVVATDTTGVGTVRTYLAAAGYGGDKAIFTSGAFFDPDGGAMGAMAQTNVTNLVSNTGVVLTDTTGVGTSRQGLAASGYGVDKAIFGFGLSTAGYYSSSYHNITNLVSNTGVVSSDQTGVGTSRQGLAAAGFSSTA